MIYTFDTSNTYHGQNLADFPGKLYFVIEKNKNIVKRKLTKLIKYVFINGSNYKNII